jgi:hypothetical protein
MNDSIARTTDKPINSHHPWCVGSECYTDSSPTPDRSQHFGAWAGVPIDASDCLPWRCEPEGAPEIVVRAANLDGHPAVELQHDPTGNTQSTSGSEGISWLTPTEAHALAALISRAADTAGGNAGLADVEHLSGAAKMVEIGWREPTAWTTGPAGDRFRFTYGTDSRTFDDGCYNFEVRMQRYEYVSEDGTESIDGKSISVAEAEITAGEARELAALLVRLAEAVER